jgi:tellurite resistance protein TerC
MTSPELLQGLSVIASLVIIEGLLSVDNVLGIAALARELPENQQKIAIRLGLAGAYVFRVLALLVAAWLCSNTWVRWLGAGYLLWLMCSHLTRHDGEEGGAGGSSKVVAATLAGALLQIGLMDLSLSIDNVIAAVGLAPKLPDGSLVMWPIYTGVFIAILALQAIAPHAMKLITKYPVLEPTAFILIGLVGGVLIYEEAYHLIRHETIHIPPYFKFVVIIGVILLAMLYSAEGVIYRVMKPLVAVSKPVMRGFAGLVGAVFLPLVWGVSLVRGNKGGN